MPTPGQSLVGFLDQATAINLLKNACVVADPSDAALAAEWQAAQAKLGHATPNAGNPAIEPIPAAGQAYIDDLTQQDWIKAAFSGPLVGASFQMVEIDPLLAFQLSVDTSRSEQHNCKLPAAPNLDHLLEMCLPKAQAVEPLEAYQSPGSLMIKSKSLNFQAFARGYVTENFVGLHVGVSLPLVHVVRHNGKCYLHNGFHRAVGLRKLGVTHIPCVFRDVPSHDAVGINSGTFSAQLLESANPPTLAHFTQGRAHDVQLKSLVRTLHVSWAEYVTSND